METRLEEMSGVWFLLKVACFTCGTGSLCDIEGQRVLILHTGYLKENCDAFFNCCKVFPQKKYTVFTRCSPDRSPICLDFFFWICQIIL